jgi:O-antigen/teichoic acid export membrane protein
MFYAYQKASLATLNQLLLNSFALIILYILIQNTSGSLIYLSLGYGFSMILPGFLLTSFFFAKHRSVIPSVNYIDVRKIKEIASLGIKFFSIQIAALIIFTTDNLIITQILGPEQVTTYNIVFKLFSIILIIHGIICAPLWSAYTDAYAKGDIKWIRDVLKRLNLLMFPIILCILVLGLFSKKIVKIWIGPEINFQDMLVIYMSLYAIIAVWNNIYANFVNGLGMIKPQLYTSVLGGIINIPISIYFAKQLGMGNAGVILGTIISLAPFAVVGPIQSFYIINKLQ